MCSSAYPSHSQAVTDLFVGEPAERILVVPNTPAGQTASYAGIIPRQFQTGVPLKPTSTGKLPRSCNHHLRNYLLQAAHHVGTTYHPVRRLTDGDGSHVLLRHFLTVDSEQRCSRLSTARKLLRIGRHLQLDHAVYLPEGWVGRFAEIPLAIPWLLPVA